MIEQAVFPLAIVENNNSKTIFKVVLTIAILLLIVWVIISLNNSKNKNIR